MHCHARDNQCDHFPFHAAQHVTQEQHSSFASLQVGWVVHDLLMQNICQYWNGANSNEEKLDVNRVLRVMKTTSIESYHYDRQNVAFVNYTLLG